MTKFSIIILAAGESKRMGQAKQLLPIRGKSLLAWVAQKALSLQAEKTIVVTGARQKAMDSVLKTMPLESIYAPDWKKGMGHSLASGLSYLFEKKVAYQGVMVLLVDQPAIMMDDHFLEEMLKKWRETPDRIVASQYGDRYGVPCIIPTPLTLGLLDPQGDQGARTLLNKGDKPILGIAAKNLHHDLDSPEDYQRFLAQLEA
ncbi:nucleotidyltransferase family protein [Persicobacter diffluens]|uniref:4-diphosphocytidyl-2C-methyl-D-erythritol kinase n=1 Tax=Persicobacter diffluens TaxID=981 RepID=A0AAN5ALG2_9BACT|nr:4-diphosphocytidyl-2C-methyl-D-erythritol kinase [Persicobacter diffluens]